MAETESPVVADIENVRQPDAIHSVGEASVPIDEPSDTIASTVNDEKPETHRGKDQSLRALSIRK